jgi:hypothetical protein
MITLQLARDNLGNLLRHQFEVCTTLSPTLPVPPIPSAAAVQDIVDHPHNAFLNVEEVFLIEAGLIQKLAEGPRNPSLCLRSKVSRLRHISGFPEPLFCRPKFAGDVRT